MKILLGIQLVVLLQASFFLFLFPLAIEAITREECLETYLPDHLACYDSASPSECDPLPIPEEAFPTQELNERGYALIPLRDNEHTKVYAVTDNTAFSLIVLDMTDMEGGIEEPVVFRDEFLVVASRANGKRWYKVEKDGATKANDPKRRKKQHDGTRRKLRGVKGARLLEATLENKSKRRAKKPHSNKRQPKDDVKSGQHIDIIMPGQQEEDSSLDEEITLAREFSGDEVEAPPTAQTNNLPAEDSSKEEEASILTPKVTPIELDTSPPTFHTDGGVETGAPSESPVNTTEKPPLDPKTVSVAMIDFPEAFLRRDAATGEIKGNLNLMALEEILMLHGREKANVAQVQLVYTHGHTDHTGGANVTYPVLKEVWEVPEVTILSTHSVLTTYETLIDLGFWTNRAPLPELTLQGSEEGPIPLQVGQNTVIELYPANGHTSRDAQDLIVYIARNGDDSPPILMFADAIYPQWSPFFRFGTDDLLSYIILHDKLLAFDLEGGTFIGGHVNQLGTREDIMVNQALVNTVLYASTEALEVTDVNPMARELGFFDPTSVYYNNRWALFRQYLRLLNINCAKLVVEQFGCHLAGVDAVAESLCDVGQLFWGIVA